MGKKEKKEKITYYDDGRTIADMSGVSGGWTRRDRYKPPAPFREIWRTYWDATRMMLAPALVAGGCMCVIFLIIYLLFSLAG